MPRTSSERYCRAVGSSDLTPAKDQQHLRDVDVLMAAGHAGQGGADRSAALALYRAMVAPPASPAEVQASLRDAVEWGALWLHEHSIKLKPAPYQVRRALAAHTLSWVVQPNCRACTGRGNLPVGDTGGRLTRICSTCRGSGRRDPLAGIHPRDVKAVASLAHRAQVALDEVAGQIHRRLRRPEPDAQEFAPGPAPHRQQVAEPA